MQEICRVDDDLRIVRLEGQEDAVRWRASFTGAYQTIFSGEPYFEHFYPSEAEGRYQKLTSIPGNITLLAVRGITEVAGFGVSIPLRFKLDVARELEGHIPIAETHYLAELGVLTKYRGRGLGRALIHERLKLIDPARFSRVVLRVSAGRNTSYDLYRSMGFEDMGVYMEVQSRRTDGRVTTDRRLFLSKLLSAVEL